VSKAKDIFGVVCATAAIGIWGFVACSGDDDEPRHIPVDETATSAPVEEVPRDPFQDEFDSAWDGMDQSTRDAYCWSLKSMTPQELADFSAEMTGQDPADWQRVADMIQQKCTGE
jgi:hypothetical protein